jgi:hypothetical protein
MPPCLGTVAWIFALIAGVPFARAGDSRTPPDAFGHLPTLEEVMLSPDGSKIAFVKTVGDQRDLLVVLVGEAQAVGGAHLGDAKLRGVQWMNDDNLLITSSNTGPPPLGFSVRIESGMCW